MITDGEVLRAEEEPSSTIEMGSLSCTLQNVVNFIKRQPPYNLVQISAVPGYILLMLMIFNQLRDYIPDGWDHSYKIDNPEESHASVVPSASNTDENGVTFVTAYFYLGTIQKGDYAAKYYQSPDTYNKWMSSFGMFNNSVIAYTDSDDIENGLRNHRSRFPSSMTKIIRIDRDNLWSFKLAPKIKEIYSQPGYPKYHPNTVNEYYSCAMHAKYDLIEDVIQKGLSNTKYLAWIDIGYFREKYEKAFKLIEIEGIKQDHVTFLQIKKFYDVTAQEIINSNMVWIAGGILLGQAKYLLTFIEDYRSIVESMIVDRLMSTDQQVLYVLYSKQSKVKPRVRLHTYHHKCRCDWFYVGNLMMHTAEIEYLEHVCIDKFALQLS